MKENKQATRPTLHQWQRAEGTQSKLYDPGNAKAKEISEEKGTRQLCPAPNQKHRKAARRGIYGFRFELAPGLVRAL